MTKEDFRRAMIFGLTIRRVCKLGKENKVYLFDCPICGGDAIAMKTKDRYYGKCNDCGIHN